MARRQPRPIHPDVVRTIVPVPSLKPCSIRSSGLSAGRPPTLRLATALLGLPRGGALRLGRAGDGAARGRRALERPQGRHLDGAAPRSGQGAPAARLGGAEADRLVDPGAAAAAWPRRHTPKT